MSAPDDYFEVRKSAQKRESVTKTEYISLKCGCVVAHYEDRYVQRDVTTKFCPLHLSQQGRP